MTDIPSPDSLHLSSERVEHALLTNRVRMNHLDGHQLVGAIRVAQRTQPDLP